MITAQLSAQNYTRDISIKLGGSAKFSYRPMYNGEESYEFGMSFGNNGIRLMALKQFFTPAFISMTDNFDFVYGYGIHTGVTYHRTYQVLNRVYHVDDKFSPVLGLDGIAGLEYRMPEAPVIIGMTVEPYFEYSLNRFFTTDIFEFFIVGRYRF
jgi:hypothetical protein